MRKTSIKPLSTIKSKKNISRLIAVGASAGGLEALKTFFANLPQGDNNSYVIIQHLSPDYKSMMGELLAKSTNLVIEEIKNDMEILPGRIYLIPPVNNLVLENNKLCLQEKPKDHTLNLPIDLFLQSLATTKKEKAIAIILSGTGSDGTRGIRAIKEKDGLVMVQDPNQAKFDGMPKSAINTGLVDYVLPVEDMGNELKNFLNATADLNYTEDDIEYDDQTLSKILLLVDKQTGLDFSEYKSSTLVRRVARRVNVCKCSSLGDYFVLLQSNPDEVEILSREFLIGVTKFFRDTQVWQILEEQVIPELVASKENGETLKIWDVACSTGEEAYSLAMFLSEEMERQGKDLEIKIFATDIAQKHLEIGGKGIYSESIVADVEQHLLDKYFTNKSQGYLLAEKIRRMVIFSKHDVLKNPPFSNMDMVLCRNLLIYFQPVIQKKALDVLHYSLKENGFLVLGTSESVSSHREFFTDIDRKWKIYRNATPRKKLNPEELRSSASRSFQKKVSVTNKTPGSRVQKQIRHEKFVHEFNETILEQFGGASVFVDSKYNILQAIGEFKKFANLPTKGFSIDLLEMLSSELKQVIQSTVKKAKERNEKIFYKNALYNEEDETRAVDIII
ncbi:MAG: CheR family methyltransferase, partial [Gillisia sp.]